MGPTELARQLGVSFQKLNYHRKKPDCPPLHDVEAWRKFMGAHAKIHSAEKINTDDGSGKRKTFLDEMAEAKLGILKAARHDKERNNKIKDNQIFGADEVTRFISLMVSVFFSELARLEQEYPVTLKGKNEIQIHTEVKKQNDSIRSSITDKVQQWDRTHTVIKPT